MQPIRIEILNPKAMQLIKGMQELKLIRVSEDPVSNVRKYLKETRRKADSAPSVEDIAGIVKKVRSQRYDKK
ncbi:MAG: hypothetical protein V4642_15555 [Bacteroidota bacterium]